mmetsp:Transcript_6929/g.11425  ORF Transcript_6929/g.11425 Transcript_6929/m.11425 type:complete len:291 (-) Transcript_6929:150-1022(-)
MKTASRPASKNGISGRKSKSLNNKKNATMAAKKDSSSSSSSSSVSTPREPGTRRKRGLAPEELKAKGNEAFKDQKYDQAIDFFKRAIALDPHNHIYYSNRSATYTAKALGDNITFSTVKGLAKQGILDAKKCISLERTFGKGYMRWATALMLIFDFKAAVRVIKKGLEAVPKDPLLTKNLKKAKEKLARWEKGLGVKRRRPSGFRIGEEDTAAEKARKEELKELRRQFLEESKLNEISERNRLLKAEGIILPKSNIMGAPSQSGFQPFGDYFTHKNKRRKRRRKRISAYD